MSKTNPQIDERLELQAVYIDKDQINDEFIRLSSDLHWWGCRYADAQVAVLRANLGVKKLKKAVYLQHRASKDKGDTEGTIDARVQADPDVGAAEELVIQREADRLHLQAVVEAIRTKREMLISLGAHVRAELKGDPLVRRADYEDRRRAASLDDLEEQAAQATDE